MMNRADQNWPDGMVIEIDAEQIAVTVLAPYAHELNGSGTDCAVDCPACQWVVKSKLEVL